MIENADIGTGLDIRASDVVIRNSRISGSGLYGVFVRSGSLTIDSSTIIGFSSGIAGNRYTATRVEVTGAGKDGFKIGSNVTIQESWCHDIGLSPGAHADCGQIQTGVTHVVIRNNWFDVGKGNAALFMAPDLGPSSAGPVRVEGNTLGGGNFTVFCEDGDDGRYVITDITLRDNRFLPTARYGPLRVNVPVTASGNVMVGTGKAVTP